MSGQQRGPEIHRGHPRREEGAGQGVQGLLQSKHSLTVQDHQPEMTQILCPLGHLKDRGLNMKDRHGSCAVGAGLLVQEGAPR